MKKFLKTIGFIIGGLFVLLLVVAIFSSPTEVSTPAVSQNVQDGGEISNKTIEQQEKVQEFYDKIINIEKPFFQYLDELETALASNDIFTVYEASTKAHTVAKNIMLEYSKLEVPSGLDKEVKNLLKEASTNMQTAYYVKKEGLESLQKFLDDKKPSELQNFKDKSNSAQGYVIKAVANATKSKELVGL